jgi:nitrite reductase (NADH) small subunit
MSFVDIAPLDRLPLERGVAALVGNRAVAVFRLADDEVVAIDHVDPFTGAPVLARGIVASADGRDVVVSPLHKQRFDLRTGECLDDPKVHVRCWRVVVVDGIVKAHLGTQRGAVAA